VPEPQSKRTGTTYVRPGMSSDLFNSTMVLLYGQDLASTFLFFYYAHTQNISDANTFGLLCYIWPHGGLTDRSSHEGVWDGSSDQ
jgi:hypothetical protein